MKASAANLTMVALLGLSTLDSAIAQTEPAGPRRGTEAAVRTQIEGWQKGRPVTGNLMPAKVKDTVQQRAAIQKMFEGLGVLQSLTFEGRDEHDWDFYLAAFEHGSLGWSIGPLVNGKINDVMIIPASTGSRTGPSQGSQAALKQLIDGFSVNAPAYQIMVPETAEAIRKQVEGIEKAALPLGALQALAFQNVNASGWDFYRATYQNGEVNWIIEPLIDGKIRGIRYFHATLNNAAPHPDREASLRRYIESLESGTPNYSDMAESLAKDVREQAPDIIAAVKALGRLQAITFEHGTPQGVDVYLATFELGKIDWNIGALTAEGKVQQRSFEFR